MWDRDEEHADVAYALERVPEVVAAYAIAPPPSAAQHPESFLFAVELSPASGGAIVAAHAALVPALGHVRAGRVFYFDTRRDDSRVLQYARRIELRGGQRERARERAHERARVVADREKRVLVLNDSLPQPTRCIRPTFDAWLDICIVDSQRVEGVTSVCRDMGDGPRLHLSRCARPTEVARNEEHDEPTTNAPRARIRVLVAALYHRGFWPSVTNLPEHVEVTTVEDVWMAIDRFMFEDFDVVMCDFAWKDPCGRRLFRVFRAIRPAQAERIVLLAKPELLAPGGWFEKGRVLALPLTPESLYEALTRRNLIRSEARIRR